MTLESDARVVDLAHARTVGPYLLRLAVFNTRSAWLRMAIADRRSLSRAQRAALQLLAFEVHAEWYQLLLITASMPWSQALADVSDSVERLSGHLDRALSADRSEI